MKPSLAFPYYDPSGKMFPHLQAILPDLKEHFGRTYICPPLNTRQNTEIMACLEADPFFYVFPLDKQLRIGEHFKHLYLSAARVAQPDEIIHLAYLDRLSFALEGEHRTQFLTDMDSLSLDDVPLIFHRSAAAWATHPQNYARLEKFVTRIGETLFGQSLEYGWCHLAVCAEELRTIMPKITTPGLSMVAEMILHMQHHIHVREVDWLSWEDPFIDGRDPDELKAEREASVDEYEGRLSYCLPMVEVLVEFSMNGK
jgi:hypothetical protein